MIFIYLDLYSFLFPFTLYSHPRPGPPRYVVRELALASGHESEVSLTKADVESQQAGADTSDSAEMAMLSI